MTEWKTRVRAAFETCQRIPDDDVIEELAQHAQAAYQTARADGLTENEAVARVGTLLEGWRRDASSLRHQSPRAAAAVMPPHEAPSVMAGLSQDVRYAARLLRRQPRFALLSIATIAL